jgi:arginyl-tRNA synthetase
MSTRRGNVVFMDDLLDEATARATEVVSTIRTDLDDESLTTIGEAVGISSVRFNILRVSPEKGINFRWEDALSLEADSAPFLMYSHARACSIVRRLLADGHDVEAALTTVGDLDWSDLSESAAGLVRSISRFAEQLNSSIENRRPNQFCSYLLGLATDYNRFYRDNPVRTPDGIDVNNLALSEAARHLICAGCKGFGVVPLESM